MAKDWKRAPQQHEEARTKEETRCKSLSFDFMRRKARALLMQMRSIVPANWEKSTQYHGEALNVPIPSWKFSRRVSLYAMVDATASKHTAIFRNTSNSHDRNVPESSWSFGILTLPTGRFVSPKCTESDSKRQEKPTARVCLGGKRKFRFHTCPASIFNGYKHWILLKTPNITMKRPAEIFEISVGIAKYGTPSPHHMKQMRCHIHQISPQARLENLSKSKGSRGMSTEWTRRGEEQKTLY